ncbi:hypothetical protein M0D69_31805 [Caballeronia sp. SEWSISQ10-4 2]|uniref:hypothetical protein n=1 Tax=Caballeronia sp. SEWSISQ10-4 2 TaxID=2937438 RepID=UPI00264AB65B|nr:hypothetical protein [Caballeronia sp. SEWSISQ10-4 2]MDN7182526.1 hypothetical protein [Caballeronia sp. SEWSISQ10-4 2]
MFDLFGEVVVTHDDLYAWVEAVAPAYTSSTLSFEHHVRGWSVVEKVRRAKLDGTYETTIEKALESRATLVRRLGIQAFTTSRARP